jgi:transcriptional regulator with XRE-family HTH domain
MKWNEQLKQERNLQGWTQTLLAKKLGTNTYTVSRWERGTAFPSLFYRQQLSRLFGKSLEQLGLIPEFESRRTQHRHAAEPDTASIQQAEHIAEPESRRPQHQHTAELDTNLRSERPLSNEEQRGETTHIEFVPRNASWYEPASVQQAHAAKPESCNTQRKWTPLDSEYESNEEDAIKALFTLRSENHFKLLTEKALPKEPHKSFPDLNFKSLWLVIILSGVISLATILSFHAFMPSSPGSMKAGEICLAVHTPSLPKAVELANGKSLNYDAATAPKRHSVMHPLPQSFLIETWAVREPDTLLPHHWMLYGNRMPLNTYEATEQANALNSETKASSHPFFKGILKHILKHIRFPILKRLYGNRMHLSPILKGCMETECLFFLLFLLWHLS